jgi:acyl carrier protein
VESPGEVRPVADVFEQVNKIIADLFGVEPDKVTRDTDLIEDLLADSLDLATLIEELESVFNVKISNDDIREVRTVGQVLDYVEQHIATGA